MHILQWPYNVDIHLLFCFHFDLHFTCSCFVHVHQQATLRVAVAGNPCYDSSLIFTSAALYLGKVPNYFSISVGVVSMIPRPTFVLVSCVLCILVLQEHFFKCFHWGYAPHPHLFPISCFLCIYVPFSFQSTSNTLPRC